MYAFHGLHLLFEAVFAIGPAGSSVAWLVAVRGVVAGSGAGCLEEPEGSLGVSMAELVLVEDALLLELGGGVLAQGGVFEVFREGAHCDFQMNLIFGMDK